MAVLHQTSQMSFGNDSVSATLNPGGLPTQVQDARTDARERRSGSFTTHVRHRATVACHACRSLHARCDGKTPTCNRCEEEQRVCYYPKSRRRRSSALSASTARPPLPSPSSVFSFTDNLSHGTSNVSQNHGVVDAFGIPTPNDMHTLGNPAASTVMDVTAADVGRVRVRATPPAPEPLPGQPLHHDNTARIDLLDQLEWVQDHGASRGVDSYYQFFHKAHAFAPPKTYMRCQIQQNNPSAASLYAVMNYVGGIYTQSEGSSQALPSIHVLEESIHRPLIPPSGCDAQVVYYVAALLLVSIVAFGQGDMKDAGDYLDKAISVAVEMGMNRVGLGTSMKALDQHYFEFWTRTYWYLHIMDEALQNSRSQGASKWKFRLDLPSPDFPLPGYNENNDMTPTVSVFGFADVEDHHAPEFSSLVYLIDLVRISKSTKRLLSVKNMNSAHERSTGSFDMGSLMRADALLVNWKLRLPQKHQRLQVAKTGEMDHIMLQSHLLFHSLRVLLHENIDDACKTDHEDVMNLLHENPGLEASGAGISLVTVHPRLLISSPLNIAFLSRCAMASLRSYRVSRDDTLSFDDYDFARDNLRLALGALRQAGTRWKLAQAESKQLRALAREYYLPPSPARSVRVDPTVLSRPHQISEAAIPVQPASGTMTSTRTRRQRSPSTNPSFGHFGHSTFAALSDQDQDQDRNDGNNQQPHHRGTPKGNGASHHASDSLSFKSTITTARFHLPESSSCHGNTSSGNSVVDHLFSSSSPFPQESSDYAHVDPSDGYSGDDMDDGLRFWE